MERNSNPNPTAPKEATMLVSFDFPQTRTADLSFDFGDFSSTEVVVSPLTAEGKNFLANTFGAGASSITLPKSRSTEFADFAASKGMTI